MKKIALLAVAITTLSACTTYSSKDFRTSQKEIMPGITPVYTETWRHGTKSCDEGSEPAVEIKQFGDASYILRQSKCLDFEAPFIFVLFGTEHMLVVDTGAIEDADKFPLATYLSELKSTYEQSSGNVIKHTLVFHTHSHSDHWRGDVQLKGLPDITIVEPNNSEALHEFFSFGEWHEGHHADYKNQWPEAHNHLDLGDRFLTILSIPGHQKDSIAIYDSERQWLLTGDTFYPGLIYVDDWDQYTRSIERLVNFAKDRAINAVLGTHIEMSNEPGVIYPIGSTYQPNERPLGLTLEHLEMLNDALQSVDGPHELIFDAFIVRPKPF